MTGAVCIVAAFLVLAVIIPIWASRCPRIRVEPWDETAARERFDRAFTQDGES